LIKDLAQRVGLSDQQIRSLLNKVKKNAHIEDGGVDEMVDDKLLATFLGKGSGDSMESIAKLWLVKSMMEQDKKKNSLDLNELLGYMLIMNMTKQMQYNQPEKEDSIDKLMKMAMVSKMLGGDDKLLTAMLGMNQHSTENMMRMMEMLNPTKELVNEMKSQKEMFAEAIRSMNENQLAQFASVMQMLENKLQELKKGDDLLALEQFLEKQKKFLQLRQELLGLVQEDQLAKKAVKEDGTIDWKSLLLTKGLNILERITSQQRPKSITPASPLSEAVPEKDEGTAVAGEDLLEKKEEPELEPEKEPELEESKEEIPVGKAQVVKEVKEDVGGKEDAGEKVVGSTDESGQEPDREEHKDGTEIVAKPETPPETRDENASEDVLGRDRDNADRRTEAKVIPPEK